jgi:HTH-type transcriptional repressor of NAD biosynthesis genes
MKVGFFAGKFLPWHMGHIYATMAASNYVDKLYVILASDEKTDRKLCADSGIDYIPVKDRLSWMGETLNDLKNIHILNVDDYGWDDASKKITDIIPEKITHVYSSEQSYEEYFNKLYPYAKHIVIDNMRNTVNTSGTEIRSNIYKHWNMIPNCARQYFTKKIAIVGTESCGKSTLTTQLAKYYNTNYCPEVGKDYCDKYRDQLTQTHFDSLAMDHWRRQEVEAETANKLLFVDSEAVVTQYYAEMYGFKQTALIEEIVNKQNYDLVLYLEPDVKWVQDEYRKMGEDVVRKKNDDHLRAMFRQREINVSVISGPFIERFNKAKKLVDELFPTEDESINGRRRNK